MIEAIGAWVASGRVLDAILVAMVLEGAALAAYNRLTGRGIPLRAVALQLLAGMALMLAMRAGLAGVWWGWVSLLLLLAGVLHAAELRRMWS